MKDFLSCTGLFNYKTWFFPFRPSVNFPRQRGRIFLSVFRDCAATKRDKH